MSSRFRHLVFFLFGLVTLLPSTLAGLSCSVDTSNSVVTDWANTTGWKASMTNCLKSMDVDNWVGPTCQPSYPENSTDPNPRPQFNFWKTHAMKFTDARDCYGKCTDCLQRGINAGLAVTTYCHYQAHRLTLGSTCEMGFDYGRELTPLNAAGQETVAINNDDGGAGTAVS
ncbi:MAG: hypothetical protein Q9220_003115 [cf. Caloplaca sp. 1 TL-2023]